MLWFQPHLTNQPQNLIGWHLKMNWNEAFCWTWIVDDTPASKTVDGYKAHLGHLNKCLKSNGCVAIYTACIIGQCLPELKHIYCGNKKILMCTTKDLFLIRYVNFFIDLCDLATTYYRVSRISLPLRIVCSKFKQFREIVREDNDFWMSGY